MTEIDIETAKQEIGPLLDRVAHGEQVTIVQSGRAIARVLPAETLPPVRTPEQEIRMREVLARLDALRESLPPGDYSWEEMKKLRDFGRR